MRIDFKRRERGVRLHRGMRHFIGDEAGFSNLIGFRKTFFRFAKYVVIIFFDIVGLVIVNEIRLRLHRLFRIEVGREHLVVHLDQFQRSLRNCFRSRDHTCDVVANIADLVERKRILVMADRKNAVRFRRILPNSDRNHTIQFRGFTCVNGFDPGVRARGVQDLPHQHAGNTEIIGVFPGTGGLLGGIHHRGGLANDGKLGAHRFSTANASRSA